MKNTQKIFLFLFSLWLVSMIFSYVSITQNLKQSSTVSEIPNFIAISSLPDDSSSLISNLTEQVQALPETASPEILEIIELQPPQKPRLALIGATKPKPAPQKTKPDQRQLIARVNVKALGRNPDLKTFQNVNPFYHLGAYPEIKGLFTERYNITQLGVYNDDNYCNMADLYNMANLDNIFKNKVFFTDYPPTTLPREQVMKKIGTIPNYWMYSRMSPRDYDSRKFHLDLRINTFFMNIDKVFHERHRIGQNFLCATQMYNHIPGAGSLVGKEAILAKLKYAAKPECFNRSSYFPEFYKLNDADQCKAFFSRINSQEYLDSLVHEPIQYLIKMASGVHMGNGVFVFDDQKRDELNKDYKNGSDCGQQNNKLIAQGYITNPLLLDMKNKFDFRIYVLIASTNPLIVYYHDGFLRVALSEFEKTSKNRGTHLTNTHLAMQIIQQKKNEKKTVNGLSGTALLDYHLWSFERLQKYLLDTNKIPDGNWLNNYLRPAFRKAISHIVRMTSDNFLKQSNIFELHGMDFILDDNMKLWFIESNPSPLLTGTTKAHVYKETLTDMFEITYAYFKSRMKRALKVIEEMNQQAAKTKQINYDDWKVKYQDAVKNRLEPEFAIKTENSFLPVIDENIPGHEGYYGISEECYI